jgi:four helix bundle protein
VELGYRKSIAWQKNQRAIVRTAQLIKQLPEEIPCKKIAGQLFSSVSSIGANIAEGYSDYQGNEYQRYLKISLRSAFETDHWLVTLQSLCNGDGKKDLQLLEEINSLKLETIKILFKTIESIKKRCRADRGEMG